MAHSAWREAKIRSGRGARRIILFYEPENIIPGPFRKGARCKLFYEIDPWSIRPNSEDQINNKPDDRKVDQTTE